MLAPVGCIGFGVGMIEQMYGWGQEGFWGGGREGCPTMLERRTILNYHSVMSTVRLNMGEAKANLSKHVAALKEGDRIILCRRNRPVAEIRPLPKQESGPRPVGLGKGLAQVTEAFFDPLPDELLSDFEGDQK